MISELSLIIYMVGGWQESDDYGKNVLLCPEQCKKCGSQTGNVLNTQAAIPHRSSKAYCGLLSGASQPWMVVSRHLPKLAGVNIITRYNKQDQVLQDTSDSFLTWPFPSPHTLPHIEFLYIVLPYCTIDPCRTAIPAGLPAPLCGTRWRAKRVTWH